MSDLKVRKSHNYKMFETLPFNRPVKKKLGYKKLLESMKAFGFLPIFPVWVVPNGPNKLLVKSGHHRLKAAEELGLPVYYMVWENKGTIYEFEHATTRWALEDYIDSMEKGNLDYESLKKFHEKTGIPISTCIQLLAGDKILNSHGGSVVEAAKTGDFKVGDMTLADKVGDLVVYVGSLDIKDARFARTRIMSTALTAALQVEAFDVARFKAKVKNHPHLFKAQASRIDCLRMMEDIYNVAQIKKTQIPLTFLAEQKIKK